MVQGQLGEKSETLSQKYPPQKRTGGVAQVVGCLCSKYETLSLNSTTTKKKKKFCFDWGEEGVVAEGVVVVWWYMTVIQNLGG
jgi:hypothetical protein